MGLFDRFKKKNQPTIENVTLDEAKKMTPEEFNSMLDNVPKTEEGIKKLKEATTRLAEESVAREKKYFSDLEAEVAQAQAKSDETERRIYEEADYLNKKINELQNLPGSRRANQIANEQMIKTMKEMEDREKEISRKAKLDDFNKKYFDIVKLSKNPSNDDRYMALPSDIKLFTLIAFCEEQKNCGFSTFYYEMQDKIIKEYYGEQYSDLNKRILLSMGILANIGLLDIKSIEDKENPTMFENVIKKLDLSKYDGKDLPSIVLSISNAIGKQNGKDGLLDEFFSDKLQINSYAQKNPEKTEEIRKDTPEVVLEKILTRLEKIYEKYIPQLRTEAMKKIEEAKKMGISDRSIIMDIQSQYGDFQRVEKKITKLAEYETKKLVEDFFARLKEQGVPEEDIEMLKKEDIDYIKRQREIYHNGSITEETIQSKLREVYDRYNDPQLINVYKLTPEEYIEISSEKLREQGVSEKIIEAFRQEGLKNIRIFTGTHNWAVNQYTYSAFKFFSNLKDKEQIEPEIEEEQETQHKRR